MIVTCHKCGTKIANVEKPSTIKQGAKLTGFCYTCMTKNMANGKKPDYFDDVFESFKSIFTR